MWLNKKSDTPQAADREPKNLQTNQQPKLASTSGEGTSKLNKDMIRSTEATANSAATWFGQHLRVKGEISGVEDLLIDGSVEGLVQLGDRKLTIGTTAKVTADIIAGEVVVYGKLKGKIHASGRVEIKKDASVEADLTMAEIMIEDGAYFKGTIEIERSAGREADRNTLPQTASPPTARKAAGAGTKSM